jgi:hypothetical protein
MPSTNAMIAGMAELTFEELALRHVDRFTPQQIEAATVRLETAAAGGHC